MEELKKRFISYCDNNEYDAAMDCLANLQKDHLRFPLLFPEQAINVTVQEIELHASLLRPLIQLYFSQQKISDVFRCHEALVTLLGLNAEAIAKWAELSGALQADVESICKVTVSAGEQLGLKSQAQLRALLTAYRLLSVIYFNRKPQNLEDFRTMGNRLVAVFQELENKTVGDLYALVDTFENWGRVTGGDTWLGYADYYRGGILKNLWATKNFAALCDLVDEFDDIDVVKQADPEVAKILEDRWEYVYQQPDYSAPLVLTDIAVTERPVFTQVCCVRKDAVAASEKLNIIAGALGVKLLEPYAVVGGAEKKAIFFHALLYSLATLYLEKREFTEAVRIFIAAIRWTFLVKKFPEEKVGNIIRTYDDLFKACHKNSDHENLIRVCRSLFAFCDRRKLTQDVLLCLVNAHHLLGTKYLNEQNVERMQRHYEAAEKYWELYEKINASTNESDIRRALQRSHRLVVVYVSKELWSDVEPYCEVMPKYAARLKTLVSEDQAALASCAVNLSAARSRKKNTTTNAAVAQHLTHQAFLKTCEAGDLELAKSLLEQLSEQMGFALLEPAQIDVLLDENIYTVFEAVHALAKLYVKKGLNEAAVHAFRVAVEWNSKLEERSDNDERECFMIFYQCAMLNFSISLFDDFLEDAKKALRWGNFIKAKTAADYEYFAKVCVKLRDYFLEKKKDNQSSLEWMRKADAFRTQAIDEYQREVSVFREGFEETASKSEWDKARQHCEDAGKMFDVLNELVNGFYVAKKSESIKSKIKHKIIQFITALGAAFDEHFLSFEYESCEMLVTFSLRWFEKFEKTNHDIRQQQTWEDKQKLLAEAKEKLKLNGHTKNGVNAVAKSVAKPAVVVEAAHKSNRALKKAAAKARQDQALREAQEREKAEKLEQQHKYELNQCETVVGRLKAIFSSVECLSFFDSRRERLIEEIQALRALEYVEGSQRDKARDAVIAACVDVVCLCHDVLRCEGEITACEKKGYTNFSVEQLRELHQRLSRVEKLYEGGLEWSDDQENMRLLGCTSEWHDVEDALHGCRNALRKLDQKEVMVQREVITLLHCEDLGAKRGVANVVRLPSGLTARSCFFFKNPSERFEKNALLVESCEKLLQELLMIQDDFKCSMKKMEIADICEELFKFNLGLEDIRHNTKHGLCHLVQFLYACWQAEYHNAKLDFCGKKPAQYLNVACQLLLIEMRKPREELLHRYPSMTHL